jgi:copper oxidase (laccase) domain-containing protein
MRVDHPAVMRWPEFGSPDLCTHGFIARLPGVDVAADRETAMRRLFPHHQELLRDVGVDPDSLATAEQVHGAAVAVVERPGQTFGVDALVTNCTEIPLGIYVADCAAVYFLDPVRRAIGLAHSGKKGTEGRIVVATLETMREVYGCDPADIVALVSPCIRPPHYELDFAAAIRAQLDECKVGKVIDPGICTAAHNDRFYSYRRELGQTGRMLAYLELRE